MGSVYSVLQVNNYIRNMINQDFLLGSIQVQGEVSNCKYHHSGHIYFTLKDEKAAINCIMFAGNRAGLAFSMEEGNKVIASGNIDVYEKTGSYQLYVKKIKLAGEGELFERFQALKKELEEMGMFAEEYKKPIPLHAKKVGVVTAPTGAAIRDIQNIIKRRNPGIQIVLFPALVQGKEAAESIVKGIRVLDKAGMDLIIVGRGGGSIEDLWAFNEEVVARAIFECNTPIISAVGHETDTTIADFAADLRAPTPSAAAEIASENIFDTIETICAYEKRISVSMQRKLELCKMTEKQYLQRIEAFRPSVLLARKREELEKYQIRIRNAFEGGFQRKKFTFSQLCEKMESLSPLRRISAGFSYVSRKNGKPLKSIRQVKKDDLLEINVKDGIVKSKVLETVPLREKVNEGNESGRGL